VEFLHAGAVGRRNRDEHKLVPWRTYPCKDGMAAIIGGPVRHWLKAAEMFGVPELQSDKFAHILGRMKHRTEFQSLMQPWLSARTRKEIFREGQKRNLAWGYIASLYEVLGMEQLAARAFFAELRLPDGTAYRMPAAPFCLSKTPWRQARAPSLDEHA
jgi:crotonobetainyl-CoA:carnitine CoA-transferase CaiB-like acyl-CoA transferase